MAPRAYLDLIDYVSSRWRVSRRRAREWLFGGKVNVNGEVWAYPDVPKDILQRDELGRLRVMVEGVPDPRPPAAAVLGQGRKYRPKDRAQ